MSQLTIAAAARAAGVDRATLYRHVKAGKLSLTRVLENLRQYRGREL
jgi:predicted site-specific integrase-resolvase